MAAKTRPPRKSVRLSVTHDRLSLTATYPTGGTLRFTIGRSGERLTWGGSPDRAAAKAEITAFMAAAAFRPGEVNATRMERLKAAAEAADSISGLVKMLAAPAAAVTPAAPPPGVLA